MREEVIGNCRLILGDCLEVLPTLGKVDINVDNSNAVVFSADYDKSASRKHSQESESRSSLGSQTRGYFGNVCERSAIAASNGGEVSSNADGFSAGYSENGHSAEIEGQGWQAERTLQGRNPKHSLPQDDRKETLQSLRRNEPASNPSQGQYPHKQCAGESGSTLQSMPQQPPQARVVELPQGWGIVTDPPYGLGKKISGGTWATNASHYKDMHTWDLEANQEWIDAILALKVPTIIWGGNYFIMPPSRCWLVWKKPYFPTMADCELAWCSEDANARVFDGLRSYGKKLHPTEKPLKLMQWCIKQLPPDCQTILDPFAGSFTTGVACVKMGRKFIGIEKEERYFDIGCKRIEDAYKQMDLFLEPPPKPVQEAFQC